MSRRSKSESAGFGGCGQIPDDAENKAASAGRNPIIYKNRKKLVAVRQKNGMTKKVMPF